jgi:asparagine synthase (glutamine-hydrolysing)
MCGIAGVLRGHAADRAALLDEARAMAERLAHRGPDDSGEFADPASGLALGFRRLAILDLSPAGHQPMESASGRWVLVFNGEVYNFEELRAALPDPPPWRGHSDTEVMLAAFEAWGVRGAVERFAGMFAFALWDRRERTLHLVRDRMGVKPLHYGWSGGALHFASELKALRALPRTIDRVALDDYLAYGFVPGPRTIYENVRKLPPATILSIGAGDESAEPVPYWSVADVAEHSERFRGSFDEAVERLGALVSDSVRLRMIADVPLGLFLSGGIDSSLIAATMRRHATGPVKTFTIGFTDPEYDEARSAAAIAKYLGTEHTELYVTAEEAMDAIPAMAEVFDEPFADSSQIPTYIVSRMARRSVTVALSGDGGDELFGGYHRYFLGRKLWTKRARVPSFLRGPAATVLARTPSPRLRGIAGALSARSPDDLYATTMTAGRLPARMLKQGRGEQRRTRHDVAERMMLLDQLGYLPDDILVKVDRASMAVSLEAREPLLDHRLVEFAWTLPLDMKLEPMAGKKILRALLARDLPPTLFERRKMGFGLPVGEWLRGPLRGWAESLLNEHRLREEGLIDPKPVLAAWREHLAGRDRQPLLWTVLMLEAWLRRWGG